MSTKEKIKVMQAFEDGKNIEIYSIFHNSWSDLVKLNPIWNWDGNNYRIKDEPWIEHTEDKWPAVKPSEEIEVKTKNVSYIDCAGGFLWDGTKNPKKWRTV